MNELRIDKEFQALIPPLSQEELKQLEENIKSDGCRDALVIWDGVIIDGHNRYKICQENDIPFETEEMEFNSRGEVTEWIIRNQFGRRNLSFAQRSELALKLKPVIRERAKEKQITSTGGESPQLLPNSAKAVKTDTRKELAKIAGVSPDTIWKTEKILSKGTPEQIDRARKGGKGNSVNAVYKEVVGKAELQDTEKAVDDSGTNVIKQGVESLHRQLAGLPMERSKSTKEERARLGNNIQRLKAGPVGKPPAELAALEFENNLKHFFGLLEGLLKSHVEDLKDAETNKKIMAVLSEAATTIDEWKGKYSYERL